MYSSLADVLKLLSCTKPEKTKAKNDNFLEKSGNHGRTYFFWHKEGCAVSLMAELGTTSKEIRVTGYCSLSHHHASISACFPGLQEAV